MIDRQHDSIPVIVCSVTDAPSFKPEKQTTVIDHRLESGHTKSKAFLLLRITPPYVCTQVQRGCAGMLKDLCCVDFGRKRACTLLHTFNGNGGAQPDCCPLVLSGVLHSRLDQDQDQDHVKRSCALVNSNLPSPHTVHMQGTGKY